MEKSSLTDEPRPQRDTSPIRHITRSQKSETPTHYISKQTGRKDLFVLLQGVMILFHGSQSRAQDSHRFRGIITGPSDELQSPRQASFTPKLGIQRDQQKSQSNLMGESLRCYQSVPFAAGWEQ